jgi:hypothetical protein
MKLTIGSSQPADDEDEPNIDTSYIASYVDIFTPRFVFIGKRNGITINNNFPDSLEQGQEKLLFRTNSPMNIGLGFTYKWLGFNLAFNFPFLNGNEKKYGKTKRFDLGTHIYGRKFVVDLGVGWYKGLYLANPQGIIPGWKEGDPYPKRGDISVTTIGADVFYVMMHKKFSYRSAFSFNERQKKSAGSPIVGGGVSWYFIRADSSIIGNNDPDVAEDIRIRKANMASVYAIGGYAQNFVIDYFYLSLTLGVGIGGNSKRLFIENENRSLKNASVSFKYLFRASIGYNNDLFYVGISKYTDGITMGAKQNLGFIYSNTSFNLYAGYRFYNLFKKKEPLPWLWDLNM